MRFLRLPAGKSGPGSLRARRLRVVRVCHRGTGRPRARHSAALRRGEREPAPPGTSESAGSVGCPSCQRRPGRPGRAAAAPGPRGYRHGEWPGARCQWHFAQGISAMPNDVTSRGIALSHQLPCCSFPVEQLSAKSVPLLRSGVLAAGCSLEQRAHSRELLAGNTVYHLQRSDGRAKKSTPNSRTHILLACWRCAALASHPSLPR